MADEESGQERTEQASAKRLSEARERGQLPRSRELGTMLLLGGSGITLWSTGSDLVGAIRHTMQHTFVFGRDQITDPAAMMTLLCEGLSAAFSACGPLFIVTVIASIGGSLLLGGLNFSTEAIGFKWDRIDPLQGIARMFSLRSVVELGKALAKFGLLLSCGIGVLYSEFDAIKNLSSLDLQAGIASGLSLSFWTFMAATGGTVVIALIDVPYQWWEHQRTLRMSRQDLREEHKESEGSPHTRRRIRQMQQQMSRRRMMQEIPKADVVITNPTHFAVALRFDPEKMAAPVLIAKGADEVAMRIREIARLHHVTTIEAPPLARAIFRSTKLDHEIPAGLYVAVAQVLAYVFQLRRTTSGGSAPVLPSVLPIPPELQD